MTFKCGNHKFETESIEDWDEHIEKEEHTIAGTAPCVLCGFDTKFNFTGKKKAGSVPCVCKECKGKL